MANKLELTWYGKENEIKVEPRILIENTELSSKKADIKGQATLFDLDKKEIFDNMLIHGDNLLALKALEKDYAGKIKCIYIDPPYNTGSAFEHYNDNVEHSTWLSLMKPRLELLRSLLSDDGTIYIHIDDVECAYLKVLCDEIFGRTNFITTIAVKMSTPSGVKLSHRDKKILKIKEFILVYSKNKELLTFNPQYQPKKEWDTYYEWYVDKIGEKVQDWKVYPLKDVLKKLGIENTDINNPKFKDFYLKNADKIWQRGRNTSIPNEILQKSRDNWEQIFEYNSDGDAETQYCYKGRRMAFLSKVIQRCTNKDGSKVNDIGTLICDFWDDISTAALFSEGKVEFPNGKKPETLIERILDLSTDEGDIVLDSFLGSGSTCAVAHKMNRKWIGIEMGEHAYTHAKKRIDTVISGEDQTGISKALNWTGGGGYKFYELAPTLIKEDAFGQEIINPEYNAEMLASAVAKHEGYTYQPDETVFWKQSRNGKSFLFVTTNHVNSQMIETIKADLQDDEFVLIVCKSFESGCNYEKNIVIKKIPQSLLKNCEFGRDDYSLNIICPPEYEEDCDE